LSRTPLRHALGALSLLACACASSRNRAIEMSAADQPWWGSERVVATNVSSKGSGDCAETWIQWKSRGGGSVGTSWFVRECARFADREGVRRVVYRAPRPPAPFGEWNPGDASAAPPTETVTDFAWCAVSVRPIVLVAVEHRVSYEESDRSMTTQLAVVGPWPAVLIGHGLMSSGRVPRMGDEVVWCSPSEGIAPTRAAHGADGSRIIELPSSIMVLQPIAGMWEVVEVRGRSASIRSPAPNEPLDLDAGAPLLDPSPGAHWAAATASFRMEIVLRDDGTGDAAYSYRFLPTVHRWSITKWTRDDRGRVTLECRNAHDADATARWTGTLGTNALELDLATESSQIDRSTPRLTVRFARRS